MVLVSIVSYPTKCQHYPGRKLQKSMDVHRVYHVHVKEGVSPEVQGTIDEAGVQMAF